MQFGKKIHTFFLLLRSAILKYMLNRPLQSLQTDFLHKTYAIQKKKKIHTFFLILRSSIFKLNYLYDLGSWISEIWLWGSPLNPLSNGTSLTWFGFFKTELCPISHNDLIMDWFSRVNLYDLPRVIVSSFSSEIGRTETIVCILAATLYNIAIRCSER